MTDEIMTIKELTEYLKLNEKTAYRLVEGGKIPGFEVGDSFPKAGNLLLHVLKALGLMNLVTAIHLEP